MQTCIEKLFASEKIEYFSALRYADCKVIRPDIADRCKITPKSVVVFLLPYYSGETVNISRYAASMDYHIAVREITGRIIEGLVSEFPENKFFGFGDHSPIDERHAALISGLGVLGGNRLLINEKYGSYVFIAEIISDLDPESFGAHEPMPILHCEGCGACTRACPTKSLTEECECLSAITQRKGELAEREVELMRSQGTVWGCDACQSACPHNAAPCFTPIEFFHKERIGELTAEILYSMSDEEFARRAYSWRGRKTVKRNLDVFKY